MCKARYQAHDGSGCLSRLYHYSFYIQHHLMFTTRFNGNSFIIQPHKQMLSIELGEKDMIFHCRPLQNVGKMVKVHFVRKIKQTQKERRRKKTHNKRLNLFNVLFLNETWYILLKWLSVRAHAKTDNCLAYLTWRMDLVWIDASRTNRYHHHFYLEKCCQCILSTARRSIIS